MFGIPYAREEVEDGVLIRICPVCGERIEEATDLEGERITNFYAEHYELEHPEGGGTSY